MAGQNDGGFQYEAIIQANQQIRLLQFKNVPFGLENYEHKLLKCTITTVSLNSKPEYKTLSYVWGDDTRCKPIVVNGKRMDITASLDTALRHLMLFQDLLKQQIWIDAVCINQDDNEEKAWQVRVMKDIYLNAKSSIGWLGLPDEVSRLAFETAWESKLYVDFAFAFGENAVVTDMLARVGKDIILAPTSGNMTRSNAIRLLLDRTFFTRTWIHQEVMVAKKIDLVCGTEICNWDDLQLADMSGAKHMGDAGFGAKFDLMEMLDFVKTSGPILGSPGPKCFQLRFYFEENPQAYNLWSLVVLTRAGGARSSNPRDAIYGVLSVAADSEKLKISPEYDTEVEQCFILATKAFLRHGHLDVLTACQQPRELNLPSWVPDFSTRWDDDCNIVTPVESMGKSAEDSTYGTLFTASKGTSPKIFSFERRGQQQILCLSGVKFDQIELVAPAFTQHDFDALDEMRNPDACQEALLRQVDSVQGLLQAEILSSKNTMETVLRVLIKDMEFGVQKDGHILHRLPLEVLKSYVPYVDQLRRCKPITAYPLLCMRQEYMIFCNMIIRRNVGRRAFITIDGHLGMGPAELREGDMVAIICGTDVPLLLRPCDGGVYKLLGEAYVDGIMDGEVMRTNPKILEFEIC